MITTQLFQEQVAPEKRNRVAAGQFSCDSFFDFVEYALALVWSTSDVFGSAILTTSGCVILGYTIYVGWACSYVLVKDETGGEVRVSRVKRSRTTTDRGSLSSTKPEISEL